MFSDFQRRKLEILKVNKNTPFTSNSNNIFFFFQFYYRVSIDRIAITQGNKYGQSALRFSKLHEANIFKRFFIKTGSFVYHNLWKTQQTRSYMMLNGTFVISYLGTSHLNEKVYWVVGFMKK